MEERHKEVAVIACIPDVKECFNDVDAKILLSGSRAEDGSYDRSNLHPNQFHEDLFSITEVIEDHGRVHIGLARDGPQASGLDPLTREEDFGRAQYVFLCVALALWSPSYF